MSLLKAKSVPSSHHTDRIYMRENRGALARPKKMLLDDYYRGDAEAQTYHPQSWAKLESIHPDLSSTSRSFSVWSVPLVLLKVWNSNLFAWKVTPSLIADTSRHGRYGCKTLVRKPEI